MRVSRRNAAAFDARNISPSPTPTTSGTVLAGADEQPGMLVVDDDEREVPLELREREANGLDEVALVVALDQMRDGLGVRLGGERVPSATRLSLSSR